MAVRAPMPDGSIVDLVTVLEKEATAETINEAVREAASGEKLKNILFYSDAPIVSTDIIGESHSSIVDLELISQVAPNFFRVVSWYDNENSYSVRCVDLLAYMAEKDNS